MKHTGRVPLNFCSGVYLCILVQLTISAKLGLTTPQIKEDFGKNSTQMFKALNEPLSAANELEPPGQVTPGIQTDASAFTPVSAIRTPESTPTPTPCSATISISASPSEGPSHRMNQSPKDLFSLEQRRRGWVILHIVGMLYLFLALVVVCKEFFVPAVEVIADRLAISDDVAGATVMAAGRSIPRFFAFLIGIVVAHSKVGIGTIVGPAVYNILFVIGMCALFSREALHLTCRPFFRDMTFYIFLLTLIMLCFLDDVIMWWESLILVAGYTVYIILIRFDAQLERVVKLFKHKNIAKFTAVEELETVSNCVAVSLVFEDAPAGEHESRGWEVSGTDRADSEKNSDDCCENGNDENENTEEAEKEATEDKPLSLKWPDAPCEQAAYFFLLPIILPLWLTVPDVRNQKSRRFFGITFVASILWITLLLYFLVSLGHQVGETFGIPHAFMTVLMGWSSPDLLTSVIVARKGRGDMAVSSSVGCNIFDIAVGLPVSWLLFSSIHGSASAAVGTTGLVCSCVLLFLTFLFAIVLMLCCKWRMSKLLGSSMILLYIIFLVICFLLHSQVIVCPFKT
uniref:Sodium/potassium/calcium exchanger 1 n=1 Tax=Salarias fasciatus TaxID=181472 RepID=A0A672J3K4_SALFA